MVGHNTKHNLSKNTYKSSWFGQWFNGGKGLKHHYLGLEFLINGKVHYGWARISVAISGKTFTTYLNGYAFENIPGKPIVAGQTKGPDENVERPDAALTAPTAKPASLGALALGAPGLSIWRREESVGATQ
jgi:hypothetical protein